MGFLAIHCSYCSKQFFRPKRRVNESKKFFWKSYCSAICQKRSKNKQLILRCANKNCSKVFKRQVFKISKFAYCSQSCAAKINNSKYPKKIAQVKVCLRCGKKYKGGASKYCSVNCKNIDQVITQKSILTIIKNFYLDNGRIPLKREFKHQKAAISRFGSWNNAISKAGLTPNQVLFSKKYIAIDGHKCDSLAEKIIDDWLFMRGITHIRNVMYPGRLKFTADFMVGDYWIEFFGLHGQHKKYDELMKRKLQLIKRKELGFIAIYPHDLFPRNRLSSVFQPLLKKPEVAIFKGLTLQGQKQSLHKSLQ